MQDMPHVKMSTTTRQASAIEIATITVSLSPNGLRETAWGGSGDGDGGSGVVSRLTNISLSGGIGSTLAAHVVVADIDSKRSMNRSGNDVVRSIRAMNENNETSNVVEVMGIYFNLYPRYLT